MRFDGSRWIAGIGTQMVLHLPVGIFSTNDVSVFEQESRTRNRQRSVTRGPRRTGAFSCSQDSGNVLADNGERLAGRLELLDRRADGQHRRDSGCCHVSSCLARSLMFWEAARDWHSCCSALAPLNFP